MRQDCCYSTLIIYDLICMPGVSSYDVSLDKQEVIVKGPATYDYVFEKIKKTGKEVSTSNSYIHVGFDLMKRQIISGETIAA